MAVGWVRGGDILEVAAQDATQGVVFYALDQKNVRSPELKRDNSCLACHLSWDTLGVPGLMVESVHPLPDDISYVNGYNTIHASPLEQRWGGWWVTGNPGGVRHMGNIPVMPADKGKSKLANPTRPLAVGGRAVRPGGLSDTVQRRRGADGACAPGANDRT